MIAKNDIKRPIDFNLTINFMKNLKLLKQEQLKDFDYKNDIHKALMKGAKKDIQGLSYYIDKLKDQSYINTLPEEILSISSKYGKDED